VSPSAHSLRKDEQTTVLLDGALASTPKQIECNATYFSQGYPYVVLGVKCWALCDCLCYIYSSTYGTVDNYELLSWARVRHPSPRTLCILKSDMHPKRKISLTTRHYHGASSSLDCLSLQPAATMATDETMLSRHHDTPFVSAIREQLDFGSIGT
jgi:hypothetical protein